MSLSTTTYYAMPCLYSYEEASSYEASIKPIRGDAEGYKPLGRRDQKWRHIKREDDGSIAIYEWGSKELLRYLPNGELHIYDVSYSNKASQHDVICRVTGMSCETEAHRAWIHYSGGVAPLPLRAAQVWDRVACKYKAGPGPDPAPAVFVRNALGTQWVMPNPPTILTHGVNRKGATAVRARYASGLAYVSAIAKLRGDDVPRNDEAAAVFRDTRLASLTDVEATGYYIVNRYIPSVRSHNFDHAFAADLAALLGSADPGDQYKAYVWLVRDSYDNEYVPKTAERVLMMHHHDEWLTKREAPAGKKVIDRYRWAIPTQA